MAPKTINHIDWRGLADREGWVPDRGCLSKLTVAQNEVAGATQMYNSTAPSERSPLEKIVAIAMVALHSTTAAKMNMRSMSNAKNDIYKALKASGVGVEAVWLAANAITADMSKEKREWEAYKAIWGEPVAEKAETQPDLPIAPSEAVLEPTEA